MRTFAVEAGVVAVGVGLLGATVGDTEAAVAVGDAGATVGDAGTTVGDTGATVGDTGTTVGDAGAIVGDTGAMVIVGKGADTVGLVAGPVGPELEGGVQEVRRNGMTEARARARLSAFMVWEEWEEGCRGLDADVGIKYRIRRRRTMA
jgi:hypothetical protein